MGRYTFQKEFHGASGFQSPARTSNATLRLMTPTCLRTVCEKWSASLGREAKWKLRLPMIGGFI